MEADLRDVLERRELEAPIRPVITDPELAENFSKSFTDMRLSPVLTRKSKTFEDLAMPDASKAESNPFGGFSFVASNSLLESDGFMLGT